MPQTWWKLEMKTTMKRYLFWNKWTAKGISKKCNFIIWWLLKQSQLHWILSSTLLFLYGFFSPTWGCCPHLNLIFANLNLGNVLGRIITLISKNVIEQEVKIAYLGCFENKPIVQCSYIPRASAGNRTTTENEMSNNFAPCFLLCHSWLHWLQGPFHPGNDFL